MQPFEMIIKRSAYPLYVTKIMIYKEAFHGKNILKWKNTLCRQTASIYLKRFFRIGQ